MAFRPLMSSGAALLIALGAAMFPSSPAQAAVTVLDFDYGTVGTPCEQPAPASSP